MATLDEHLERTSRTFALTIPLLDEPLRRQVTIAYLLFRIADSLEDAELPREKRLDLLERFAALIARPAAEPMRTRLFVEAVRAASPLPDPAVKDLLGSTLQVLAALDATGGAAADIRKHLGRTVEGMADFVKKSDPEGRLVLETVEELARYCYAVAGIVGEMLCELTLREEEPLRPARERLMADAAAFGEGLQLVNILKDVRSDAAAGRQYLPPSINKVELFERAVADLEKARRYLGNLHKHGARRGTLAFHALPIRLANGTLEAIRREGAGAKMTRTEVALEVAGMNASLDAGGMGV